MKRRSATNGWRLVTDQSPSDELIATARGTVTYLEWCVAEVERNNRASCTNHFHIHTAGGKVCVAAR